jgi:hypothetical protein
MDCKIDLMIRRHLKPIKMIINSNRKIRDKTAGPKIPDILKRMDIPYKRIIDDGRKIIKVE